MDVSEMLQNWLSPLTCLVGANVPLSQWAENRSLVHRVANTEPWVVCTRTKPPKFRGSYTICSVTAASRRPSSLNLRLNFLQALNGVNSSLFRNREYFVTLNFLLTERGSPHSVIFLG
jgi:hypothetical protein